MKLISRQPRRRDIQVLYCTRVHTYGVWYLHVVVADQVVSRRWLGCCSRVLWRASCTWRHLISYRGVSCTVSGTDSQPASQRARVSPRAFLRGCLPSGEGLLTFQDLAGWDYGVATVQCWGLRLVSGCPAARCWVRKLHHIRMRFRRNGVQRCRADGRPCWMWTCVICGGFRMDGWHVGLRWVRDAVSCAAGTFPWL